MEKKDITKKNKHKSKSFVESQKENEVVKVNNTFDFVNLYNTVSENSIILNKKFKQKSVTDDVPDNKQNEIESAAPDTPVHIYKKFSKSDLNKSKTSTPNTSNESKHSTSQEAFVKSIMKNNSSLDNDTIDISNDISTSLDTGKRKKRTKSVSFMLDDGEEVSQKKSKLNKTVIVPSISVLKSTCKKNVKEALSNEYHTKKLEEAKLNSDVVTLTKKKKKKAMGIRMNENELMSDNDSNEKPKKSKNKMFTFGEKREMKTSNQVEDNEFLKARKDKKKKNVEKATEGETKNTNANPVIEENSKNKKKKRKHKTPNAIDVNKEEPHKKSRKTDEEANTVVDNLESLTIGDNAHTLTDLLDEMTVADKNKKHKLKKIKNLDTSAEILELEKKDKKDKDKWKKRRLQRKPEFRGDDVTTSIIVDNLPLRLVFDYKNLLREHFSKFGLIRKIGVAEVYPSEEPKPVFATTVYFFSEEAATSALEEDNSAFHMARMRVRRPLPPTETTLIIKCHSPLDEYTLSSTFMTCGRIRSIRKVEKSKKSISSAFIEFNSPKEVEKAINLSSTLRIGSKKVYVAKFEIRNKKNEDGTKHETNGEL